LETLGARLENDLGLSSGAGIKVKTKWGVLPTGVRAHAHLVVEGGVDVILEGSLWLAPSVSGNAECTVTFARPEIPIWGPFVAVVELGAGVDLDMAANSDPLTADLRILVPFDTKLGFKWENGDLTGYDHLSIGSPQVDFDLGVPSGFNLEASAFVFGKAELEAATAGAPAGISIVEGRFGLQQSASLRDQTTQMTFPSRYWLSPHALVRPGDGVRTMLSWVGLGGSWTQGWEGDLGGPLAESPTGSLTPWSSDVAAGNTLLGTITLQSTNYLSGYNVDEVKVYGRPSGGGLVSQLGTTVAAGSGQVQFPWSWQPMSNQTGTWEIAAFVVTKGLPLVPLRVGDVELIEVTGTSNLPPVGVDDYYALSQGDLLSIGAPGVLGNDSDPEQAPISVAHLSDPAHGSLDLFTDGSFDYYHDGSAITNDAFTYTVTDGVNESSWITVHLTIDINDPPVVVDDHYTAGRGELLSVGAPGVLDNDWDPEGSSLLLAHHSLATHGTVSMGDDGSLSYSHDGSSATSDSFTYTVTDGVNESSPATVYLTIVGSGDVRVTLNWWSTADLDLYVTDPLGEIIYYGNSTSTSGGELDVDANFPCNVATTGPVENIYWPIGGAPQGEYVVEVRYAVECNSEGPQNIQVTTIVDGALRTHFQTLSIGQQIEVARFTR
ncbi:MAG: Ig-like domain-containing protein, partial [Acidimicrobiia bacterium]|nr:Ig-like domain-containing protein [Acidimicrobiia bacterium]